MSEKNRKYEEIIEQPEYKQYRDLINELENLKKENKELIGAVSEMEQQQFVKTGADFGAQVQNNASFRNNTSKPFTYRTFDASSNASCLDPGSSTKREGKVTLNFKNGEI